MRPAVLLLLLLTAAPRVRAQDLHDSHGPSAAPLATLAATGPTISPEGLSS